jgi:hypothetical protein
MRSPSRLASLTAASPPSVVERAVARASGRASQGRLIFDNDNGSHYRLQLG